MGLEVADQLLPSREASVEAGVSVVDSLTEILKSVALDAVQELIHQFHINYSQMFEPLILQTGISDFFDNAITQKIQSKARHILNVQLDLSKSGLFHTSLDFLQAESPKTAFQVSSQPECNNSCTSGTPITRLRTPFNVIVFHEMAKFEKSLQLQQSLDRFKHKFKYVSTIAD